MANKKTIAEWEAAFKAADKDNNGSLDIYEMRDLLRKNNCNVTESQIAAAFVYLDGPQGDRRVTLNEFINGMKQLASFIQALAGLFHKFDADKSGYLDKNELRQILTSSGHKFTDAEVEDILRKADSSGDGKISFDEFFAACT